MSFLRIFPLFSLFILQSHLFGVDSSAAIFGGIVPEKDIISIKKSTLHITRETKQIELFKLRTATLFGNDLQVEIESLNQGHFISDHTQNNNPPYQIIVNDEGGGSRTLNLDQKQSLTSAIKNSTQGKLQIALKLPTSLKGNFSQDTITLTFANL
jgi:hypothetical protein